MKNTLNKSINILKAFIFVILLGLICSCSDSFIQKNENFEKTQFITFKARFPDAGRTVLPQDPDINGLSDFIISRRIEGGGIFSDYVVIGRYDSYSDLVNTQLEIPDSLMGYRWFFKISAAYNDIIYEGFTDVDLRETNTVEIVLYNSSLGDGVGALNYVLDYSQTANAERVDYATVSVTGVNTQWSDVLEYNISVSPDDGGEYSITYSYGQLPAGNYRIVFTLYSNNIQVGYWQEFVKIATGLLSTATRALDYLNIKNQINFDLCDSEESPAILENDNPIEFIASVKSLPLPTREGYIFKGWYTDSNYSNPVQLPLSTTTTLYAKWQIIGPDDIIVTADNAYNLITNHSSTSSTINIYLFGDANDEPESTVNTLAIINEAVSVLLNEMRHQTTEPITLNVDLSNSNGITRTSYNSFSNYYADTVNIILPDSIRWIESNFPVNLTSIYLGADLESIEDSAFDGCNHLEQIELSEMNESFIVENGVLYDKRKTQLFYCTNTCSEQSYVIPDSVCRIKMNAFACNQNIQTITLGANVWEIGANALSAPNLTTIAVFSENENFFVSDNCLYSSDGTELILCPLDLEEFEINNSVRMINRGAFYKSTSLTLALPVSTNYSWKYSYESIRRNNYPNESEYNFRLLAQNELILSDDDTIEYNNFRYYYKADISILDSIPSVDVYPELSFVIGTTDSTYTICDLSEDTRVFKFTTNTEKLYKVFWVNSESVYSDPGDDIVFEGTIDNLSTAWCEIMNSHFSYVNSCGTGMKYCEFTAENTETYYLKINSYYTEGYCAFRIVEQDIEGDDPNP